MIALLETLGRIYAKTKNESYIKKAVEKGWITENQYESIVGKPYNTAENKETATESEESEDGIND